MAAEPIDRSLERRFQEVVRPILKSQCLECHGVQKPKGKLDLSGYTSVESVIKDHRVWDRVSDRLTAEEMPPDDAPRQPSPHERRAILDWIDAVRDDQARNNAGDPGRVLARRLSNAEFDYTIRDLTGADIRPTREFPVDPANEAGFDNSGESLTMAPALLKKYLAAARLVADHLVLTPGGFGFAPHPVITDVDRDKYCVQRILEFYRRHQVDYADYFLAAWRYEHRPALDKSGVSLNDVAHEAGLSGKYLATIHASLTESSLATGPLGDLQAMWRKMPAGPAQPEEVRRHCQEMGDLVIRARKGFSRERGPATHQRSLGW